MSNQIVISSGAKVRELEGVLTGTSGVVNSLGINVPSGIPQLDGSGKILVSQLPNSVMEYKGSWNAATNTPTLADGTGNAGDVYLCNVAGTVNFGSGPIVFNVGDQVIYSGTIWQRASGATGTVTSVAVTESGDSLNITGSPITTSGTINIGFNGDNTQYINGAGNLTTFPSLAGYVPYTGATTNVNLGTFDLSADAILGATGSFISNGSANTFDIEHSSGSGIALSIVKEGNNEGLYVEKTSGSGNAATIIGTLNATTLVKSGGTSSQFLKADGSVDTSAYITLASLSAGTGISYNNTTGVITSTITQYTDALARAAISLTTTGTSGAATYNSTTGVLNVPNYAPDLTGYVTLATAQTISGAKTFTSNIQLGTIGAGGATATPLTINLGDSFSNTAGDNLKLRLYQNNEAGSVYGIGISASQMDFNLPASAQYKFWSGNAIFTNNVTAAALIKSGGTSSQFLKADGSVDSSTYLTTASAASTYLPLSGGTLTNTAAVKLIIAGGTSQNGISFSASGTANSFYTFNGTYVATAGYGIYNATSDTMPLFIFNNGNIGLSTTTDAGFKLDVNGSGRFTQGISLSNNNIAPTGAGIYQGLNFLQLVSGSSGIAINNNANTVSNLVLTNTGNLGLGVTPSDWNTLTPLQIKNVAFAGYTSGTTHVLYAASNFYYGGSGGGDKYITNGAASLYSQALGNHTWYNAPTNTSGAGAAMTLTQRMILASNGNLGIGIDTPTERLDVSGIARIVNPVDPLSGAINAKILSYSPNPYGLIFRGYDTGTHSIQSQRENNNAQLYPLSLQPLGGAVFVGNTTGVTGGGALQVNGNVNINGVFQINGTTIGGGGGSGVTGSGTSGNLTKWTGASTIGNSILTDNGSRLIQSTGDGFVISTSSSNIVGGGSFLALANSTQTDWVLQQINASFGLDWWTLTGGITWARKMTLTQGGLLGVGTTAPTELLHLNSSTTTGAFVRFQSTTGSGVYIGGRNDNMEMYAGGAERARITSTGSLLIGTMTDIGSGYKLQVAGSISMSYASFFNFRGSSGAGDVLVDNSGSTLRITGNVSVAGSVTATGGFFDTSDSRLKIVIKDYNKAKGIEKVKARLYIKNNKKELGYFAQEIEEILPSAVGKDTDGYLTLSYSQVHTAKIAYLEDKVAQLEELIKSLL